MSVRVFLVLFFLNNIKVQNTIVCKDNKIFVHSAEDFFYFLKSSKSGGRRPVPDRDFKLVWSEKMYVCTLCVKGDFFGILDVK